MLTATKGPRLRVLVVAVIAGAAIGAALLGPLTSPSWIGTNRPSLAGDVPSRALADGVGITAGHSDSNTSGETVRLNQNIIDGVSTSVCTRDADLRPLMDEGVQAWNRALSDLGFPAFALLATASCAGANIEVVKSSVTSCTNSFDTTNGTGTRACYRSTHADYPPRKKFSNAGQPGRLQDRALIIYQALAHEPQSREHLATMMHELGHSLGLGHYLSACPQLRPAGVDQRLIYFSVMTASGDSCEARGVVTGSDLRDFYEAYHVAPVTNIGHTGSGPASSAGIWANLSWGADGAREAWHNASRLAVMAQTTSGWRLVTSLSISERDSTKTANEDGAYRPIMGVRFTDSESVASLYKLVGVTKGDIQLNPLDEDVRLTVDGSTATYQQGDPSYVAGLTLFDSSPPVLSASLSPRYCFQNGTVGTLSTRATGGVGSVAVRKPSRVCPQQVGTTTFVTSATWGAGTAAIRRQVSLAARVNSTPTQINFAEDLTASPTSCVPLEPVRVTWRLASNSPAATVWIDGVKAASSPATFRCPRAAVGDTIDVQILALRSDGGGSALTVDVVQLLTLAFSRGNTVGETCTTGALTRTKIDIARGMPPYTVTVSSGSPLISGNPSIINKAGTEIPRHYICPSTPGNSTLRVSVSDATGRSVSREITLTAVRPPSTPTSVRVSGKTATTATLTWTNPAGSSNVKYGLWRSGGQNAETTSTSYTLNGLIPYQTYNLYVWSKNAAGAESTKVKLPVTLPGRPGVVRTAAPTGVRASGVTTNSATLSWNAVSGATGYSVWRSGSPVVDLPATARSHTFTGLLSARRYALTVRAIGYGGISTEARVWQRTLGPAPSAPSGLRTTINASAASATLRWNAVNGAAGYDLWRSGGQGEQATGASHTFSDLIPYRSYNLYVRARSASGAVSSWAIVPVSIPGRPGVPRTASPTGLRTSGVTSSSVTLHWNAVAGATSYRVSRSGAQGVSLAGTARSYTFTHITIAGRYKLSVRAFGRGGASRTSKIRATIPAPATTPPSQPTGLSVSPTHNSLTLSWRSASRAASYDVRLRHNGTVRSTTRTSHTFSGLTSNTSYTLFVRARNAGGASLWNSYTGTTTPPQPTGLSYSATSTSITLSWTADILADRYGVKRGASGSETGTSRTSYTFSGLTANTGYTLYVRAKTPAGSSPWASLAVRTAPASPSGLSAAATSSSLTLTWSAVSGATSYEVKRGSSGSVTRVTSRSRRFTGLSANTSYTLYVRARNSGGASGWTSITQRTSRASLTAPTGLSISSTTSSLTLTWSAVSGATSYQVKRGSSGSVRTVSSGRSYTFSGLTADTSYTLYVRARKGSTAYGWSSKSGRTSAITFNGRIRARIRSTGRVEFCFQLSGSSCVFPSSRYVTPIDMVAGRWYYSSSVSATVAGARRTLGKISVMKPSGASYIDVCFTPSGGSRVCPSSNNFYWGSATVDSWRYTDWRTYTLSSGASGQAESPESAMNPPDAGESDTPGADGGLMGPDP